MTTQITQAEKKSQEALQARQQKGARFRALHEADGGFVIPNPWDIGSAKLLTSMGYQALATTSAGLAYSIGLADGQVSLLQKIAHCRTLVAATDLPISADMEKCFDDDPEGAAQAIKLVAQAGAVGASIEDWSDAPDNRIYEFDHAVERVTAAVEAARALPADFMLTARSENFLRGRPDLDDTISRLQAFEAAGADVLYAPGLTTLEQVREVTSALKKPVNVLGTMVKGATVAELIDAGAKRISVGSALSNAALVTLMTGGRELLDQGTFGWIADGADIGAAQKLIAE